MTFRITYRNDVPWWQIWRDRSASQTFRNTTLNGDKWINIHTGDRADSILERRFEVFRRKMLREGHHDTEFMEIRIT